MQHKAIYLFFVIQHAVFCYVVKSKTCLILTIVLGEKIKDNQIGKKEFEDDATWSTLHPHFF